MNKKRVKELTEAAEEIGVTVVSVEQSRGDHMKVVLRKGDQVRTSFAALTSSDHRSVLNWRSDVRRLFAFS